MRTGTAIGVSLFLAFLLSLLPLPPVFKWFKPDWVALVLMYWTLATPERIRLWAVWLLGLLIDVKSGALFGSHGLALTVLVYLTYKIHLQLRVHPLWQQALVVMGLLFFYHLLLLMLQLAVSDVVNFYWFWGSALVGALLWPWLFLLLRDYRRKYSSL